MESPLFAIAVGALMAIVGLLMAMHPEWRNFGWVAILVLAALFAYPAAAFALKSLGIEENAAALKTTVLFGCAVLSVSIGFSAMCALDPPWAVKTTNASYALLRLQFFGQGRLPTEIRSDNVTGWYAYYSSSAAMDLKNQKGDIIRVVSSPTWAIFINLDRPTTYKEVVVGFTSPDAPIYDVLQASQRQIVVGFRSNIPAGEVEVSTK